MDQINIPPNQPLAGSPVDQNRPDYFTPLPPQPIVPTPRPESPPPAVDQPRVLKIKSILIILAVIILMAGVALLIISYFPKKRLLKTQTALTYWGLFEPASVFQQVIADYEKTHPKVKINYSQENLKYYRERLQAALARNEGPDIFRIHQSWVPMMGSYLSSLPTSVYDSASFEKNFYPSAKESLKFHNQYVAIPLEYDGLALYYNEDLFKAIGVSPPKTWGELKKAACELTVKDEQGKIRTAGVALGTTANVDHWSDILGLMILQNGASLSSPDVCPNNACLGRDALIFFTAFITSQACEGETANPGPVWNNLMPSSTYAFASGNLAMYFGPSWRVFDIKAINPGLNFKIVPVPQLPGANISWSSYWVEAVSKNSKYQEQAWEFLKYLSSSEVMQRLYKTESNLRLFGEPYSRTDLASLLKDQPYISAYLEQAPFAKSWYLSSNTNDNGINQQIIKYYEDAVNAVNSGADPASALSTVAKGVSQVLGQYGLTK